MEGTTEANDAPRIIDMPKTEWTRKQKNARNAKNKVAKKSRKKNRK